MKGIWWRRGGLAALAVFLFWLYGGDVLWWTYARAAPVSATSSAPAWAFAVVALLGTAGAVGATLYGWATRSAFARGDRLLPIVAVVLLFVDLFILGEGRSPFAATAQAAAALRALSEALREDARPGQIVPPKERVAEHVDAMGRPPYLVHGKPVSEYRVEIREPCQGPVESPGESPVGTVFLCIGLEQAWLSLVGLPAERSFGERTMVSEGGRVLSVPLRLAGVPAEPGDVVSPQTPGGNPAMLGP